MSFTEELRHRASEYAKQRMLLITDELGHGVHGSVFTSEGQSQYTLFPFRSAIKAYRREEDYLREVGVYHRLKEKKIAHIRGHHVPQLLGCDENWLVLEMTLVTRPFVLDFAGAYLDRAPDFSEEVMADWRADKQEQFGKRWPEVQAILAVLETHGIFMEDVHPGNIAFADSWCGRSS
jgi:hypothetical protein